MILWLGMIIRVLKVTTLSVGRRWLVYPASPTMVLEPLPFVHSSLHCAADALGADGARHDVLVGVERVVDVARGLETGVGALILLRSRLPDDMEYICRVQA